MGKKVKFVMIISVLFSVVFLLIEVGNPHQKDRVIATVNDEKIYESELEMSVKSAIPLQSNKESNKMEESLLQKEIEQKALEKLIHKKLVLEEAKKENFTLPPKKMKKTFERIESSFQNKKEFQEVLDKYNLTDKLLKKQIKEELIVEGYLERKLGHKTTEHELRQKELEAFLGQLRLKHEIDIHI